MFNTQRTKISIQVISLKLKAPEYPTSSSTTIVETFQNFVVDQSTLCHMTSQNTRYVALILEEGSKLANVLTIDAEQNNRKSLEKLDFLPKNDEYFIPKQISCVDPRTEYLHWKKHKRNTVFY